MLPNTCSTRWQSSRHLQPGNEQPATSSALALLQSQSQPAESPKRIPERPRFPFANRRGREARGLPLLIDDTAGLSISELRAKARRLKAQHDIQLIVIDYLQLLKGSSRRSQDNRQLEISEISAGIKALAKELNIPII